MAVILIASDDFETASILSAGIESLGHTPLILATTANIVEDIVLNDVGMVLLAEDLAPYSGWAACELLRSDPTIPEALPVVLLTHERPNVRRLEKCRFSGTLNPLASGAELREVLGTYLGEHAAPHALDSLGDLELP